MLSSEKSGDPHSVLERLGRPVDEARGIPVAWYIDPQHFTLEETGLFRAGWLAVCFSHEIADPGDVRPEKVCGSQILLVRDDAGTLRAFYNICRHRASLVVQEPARNVSTLRCNYHCWTYGLDGKLRNAPYFEGKPVSDGGEADISLLPVRCAEREGIVFVNLDGKAPGIDDHLAPMTARWEAFDRKRLDRYTTLESAIPANWKVVLEGFLEVYHEKFIHKDLGYRLDKSGQKTFEDLWTGELMGFRSVMPPENPDHPELALPRLPGMPAIGPTPTEIFLMFPNVSFNILENHLVHTIWTIVAPRETRWKSTWYFAPGATATDAGRSMCDDVVKFWQQVRREDLGAVLAVQAGLESRTTEPVETRYSPFWEPILQHFHRRIARGLVRDSSTGNGGKTAAVAS